MKSIYTIVIKVLMNIHNKSYKFISKFAIKLEGGTHPKHRLMNYHQFFIKNIHTSDNVLDIGCGKGIVAQALAPACQSIVGIDIVPENISYAQKHHSHPHATYIVGDATKYQFDRKFDVIILSNVLEHIDDRVGLLKKCTEIAPKILLRVPLITRSWMPLYQKELGIDYRLDPTHTTEYTIEQVESEAKKSGLAIQNYSVQFGEFWGILK